MPKIRVRPYGNVFRGVYQNSTTPLPSLLSDAVGDLFLLGLLGVLARNGLWTH